MNSRLLLLTLSLTAAVSLASAEDSRRLSLQPSLPAAHPSSLVSPDPLMKQIFHQQLTLPNGGIKGYAAPRSGPAIELEMGELGTGLSSKTGALHAPAKDLATGLNTHLELKPSDVQAPPKKKAIKAASLQLKKIEVQKDGSDWGESRRKPASDEPVDKSQIE